MLIILLTLFPLIVDVCFIIFLWTLVAYIANNMDSDQYAPKGTVRSGLIVSASMMIIKTKKNAVDNTHALETRV